MNKTKFKYVKYTKLELDRYVRDEKSCIKRTNSEIHVGFPPWGFSKFEETLTNIISRDKIGKYDVNLDGIVLEVQNIKVFGSVYPVHDDDPYNHINIRANFYVFQPQIGSIIKGVVKHISHGHVAVIIYRVFNVSIRFDRSSMQDSLEINQKISFHIKKFELQGAMPYIEGELIEIDVKTKNLNKHLKFENDDENFANDGGDSGISTEETHGPTDKKIDSEAENSSDSDSDSDSESDNHSNEELINGLFSNVRIKQEKLSDSEENTKSNILSGLENIKSERGTSSDESDESDETDESDESDESTRNSRQQGTSNSESEVDIKQEKLCHESTSNVQASNSQVLLKSIKKEKQVEQSNTSTMFIPRPIKSEPQSDTESIAKFKTPKSSQSLKEKNTDESFGDMGSPILSSTLKIKQEPASEDESVKRKRSKKTQDYSKSLKSIENDLFDSFLK